MNKIIKIIVVFAITLALGNGFGHAETFSIGDLGKSLSSIRKKTKSFGKKIEAQRAKKAEAAGGGSEGGGCTHKSKQAENLKGKGGSNSSEGAEENKQDQDGTPWKDAIEDKELETQDEALEEGSEENRQHKTQKPKAGGSAKGVPSRRLPGDGGCGGIPSSKKEPLNKKKFEKLK